MRKGRGQPERWVCSGCVGAFCTDSPKRVQAPRSDVWGAWCVWSLCGGLSLEGVCTPALGCRCRGLRGAGGLLRPIHHLERIEPGGYGGVTGASAPRSYPLHFRPSRARPRRLPESSIHHRGRGYGGGDAGGVRGEGRRDAEPSGGHPGKAQGTSSTGDKAWRRVQSAGPAGGPRGVTLPAAPEGGLISFPRAAEVSAKCLSHLFKFYGVWPVAAGLRPGRKRVPGRRGSAGRGWPARQGAGQERVPSPQGCLDPRAGLP